MYWFFSGLGLMSHPAILNDNTNGCIGFLKSSKAGNKSALRRPLKMVAKRKKFQIAIDIVNSIANLNASPKKQLRAFHGKAGNGQFSHTYLQPKRMYCLASPY